jgi:hypothetical protein
VLSVDFGEEDKYFFIGQKLFFRLGEGAGSSNLQPFRVGGMGECVFVCASSCQDIFRIFRKV